ncbi:MAG: Mur ligase domain-containing protein, partial [Gammaproteobacteria bacterium]
MMTAELMATAHTLGGLLHDFGDVKVTQDVAVTGLAIDSRKVQAGDLFMAVAGTLTHGLRHARQA